MAVAFDGFSIRAYTARMRDIDVAKCRPFKPESDADAVELPPIAVSRFRWWANELTRLRRAESATKPPPPVSSAAICPVCRVFSAETSGEVDAHIDGCLSAADRSASDSDRRAVAAMLARPISEPEIASTSPKPRPSKKKKRSIAEIFAVAPQIDGSVAVAAVNDDDLEEELSIKSKRKRATVSDEANNNHSAGASKIKKPKINNRTVAVKKSPQKFKLQNHVNYAKKLKKFALEILNSDSAPGKKTARNSRPSTQDKQDVAEPSNKSITKSQDLTLPIRSILKNQTSVDPKSAIQANPCVIQSPDRHVRFLEGDDIVGQKKSDFCSPEQNGPGSSVVDAIAASSETAKSLDNDPISATVINQSEDDVPACSDSGTEAAREPSADTAQVELPSSPRLPVTVQANPRVCFPERSAAIPPSQGSVYDTAVPDCTDSSRLFSTVGPHGINRSLVNHVPDHIYPVAEVNPLENTCRLSEPVTFLPVNENENQRIRSQSRPDEEIVNDHASLYQPYSRPCPMDLIGGFGEWKQNAVVPRQRSADREDFFGLPLNSHGELIQSNSRGKCLYDDPREVNMIGSSTGFLPAHSHTQPTTIGDYLGVTSRHYVEREFPNDRGNLFLANSHAGESQSFQLPARFGVTYWESNERADIHQLDFEGRINHSLGQLDDLNLMNNLSFDGRRPYNQVYPHKMNGMSYLKENAGKMAMNTGQPTMRLMGKDVPIGKNTIETQGIEDGKVWTDKEMIIEHCQSGTSVDCAPRTRNFHEWIPQVTTSKYKETIPQHSMEVHGNMSAQTHFLVKAPEHRFSHGYVNWQTNNDLFQTNRNPSANFVSYSHLPTSSVTFNGTPHFRDFFLSEAEPLQLQSRLAMLPTPRDSFEHVHWRPAGLTHQQNLPHFSTPGFEFPFMDSRANHTHSPPWFQNANNGLPPWLAHAKQHGKALMVSSQPQHISSRTNILNTPSVYRSAEGASYSCNLVPSSNLQITGVKPIPIASATECRDRMKLKERRNPRNLGVNGFYRHSQKANTSVVSNSVDFISPTRSVLNLEIHDRPQIAMAPNLNVQTHCEMEIGEPGRTDHCYSTETQSSGMRSGHGSESSRVMEGMGRAGPIKLTAGTKHILKPNQNLDLVDEFVPVQSTIPFVMETSVGRVTQESQKNATKIYRF